MVNIINEHQLRIESIHCYQQVPSSNQRVNINVDIEKNVRCIF